MVANNSGTVYIVAVYSGKVYVATGDSTNSNMTIYTATATYDFGVRLLGNQRLWGRLHGGRQLLDLLRASRQLRKRLPHVQNDWLTLWVSSKLSTYHVWCLHIQLCQLFKW